MFFDDSLRTSRSFLIALAFGAVISCSQASAQSTLKIYGQVIDANGPVGGASITIVNTDYKTVTDQNGYYRLFDIPPGKYRLDCGFSSAGIASTGIIDLGDGPAVRQDIYLEHDVINFPAVYVEGDVRGSLKSSGLLARIYNIDKNDIESIEKAIHDIPGINLIMSPATGEVFISAGGIRPEGVNVLVDGRRINSLLTGRADLSELPLKAVTRIEYYSPGVSESVSDGGLGGTVNFVTLSNVKPDKVDFGISRGSLAAEDYSIGSGYAGDIWGKIQGIFEAGFIRSNYEYTDYFGDNRIRENASEGHKKYYISYANEIAGNHINFTSHHFVRKNGVPGQIITPSLEAVSNKQTSSLGIDSYRFLGRTIKLSASMSYRERNTRYQDFGSWIPYDNKYYEREYDIAFAGEQSFGQSFLLTQRFSYANNLLKGMDIIRPQSSLGTWNRNVYKIYAGADFQKSIDSISLRTGLSYALDRVNDEYYTNGSMTGTIVYNWLADIGLTSSFARAFRLPGLAEIHWQESVFAMANPELRPERSRSLTFELFSEFDLAGRWRFSAEYKDMRYTDLIYWRRSQGLKYKPVNVSKSDFFGTTVSVSYSSPRKIIEVKFYSAKSLPLNREAGQPYFGKFLTFQPLHSNRLTVRFEYKNPFLEIEMHDTGARFITEENTKKLKPFTLINLSAGLDFNFKRIKTSWEFEINNLTDIEYEYLEYQPMAPRTYRVNFNLRI